MEHVQEHIFDVMYYIESGVPDVMRVCAEDEDHAVEKFLRAWPYEQDIIEVIYRGEA